MPSLPPLAAVRVFEAAARHENFSRAAEELALTQAGVSYQIKLLEERLGVALFARKGRGMALTEAGRRIAPRIAEAFAQMEQAFASLRSENEAVLTITAPRTFATNLLAARLGAFQLLRPDLAVRLDVSDTLVDMASGEFDMAIRGSQATPAGMVSHLLFRQAFAPMAAPAFLAEHPVAEPGDLLTVPRVSPADFWWGLWLGELGSANPAAESQGGIFYDSQVLDGQAALAGQGAAMLSPIMFAQQLATGQLIQLFPRVAYDPRSFWLIYPEHKRHLAKVRAFRDWLLQAVREAAAGDPHGILIPPRA